MLKATHTEPLPDLTADEEGHVRELLRLVKAEKLARVVIEYHRRDGVLLLEGHPPAIRHKCE